MIPLVDSEDPDQIADSPIWAFTVGMCPKTRFGMIAWRGPGNNNLLPYMSLYRIFEQVFLLHVPVCVSKWF